MHPDYCHNPPNFLPPPPPPCVHRPRIDKKSYYLILFIHPVDIDKKGKAIIYRRKTLDMLYDLIGDIDEQYYHTLYDDPDLAFLDQEAKKVDIEFRIIYTEFFMDKIFKYIDPNGYNIKFDWQDIPNTNYPNQFICRHFHAFPYPHYCYHTPRQVPPPPSKCHPPMLSDYNIIQQNLVNDIIEKLGDDPFIHCYKP